MILPTVVHFTTRSEHLFCIIERRSPDVRMALKFIYPSKRGRDFKAFALVGLLVTMLAATRHHQR